MWKMSTLVTMFFKPWPSGRVPYQVPTHPDLVSYLKEQSSQKYLLTDSHDSFPKEVMAQL